MYTKSITIKFVASGSCGRSLRPLPEGIVRSLLEGIVRSLPEGIVRSLPHGLPTVPQIQEFVHKGYTKSRLIQNMDSHTKYGLPSHARRQMEPKDTLG